jgi:hypothetical protein
VNAPREKPRGKAAAQTSRLRIARRRGVAVFAVLLVVLFAGLAVAQGIGKPDVPSGAVAVIEDVPGDVRTVTDCNGKEVEDDPGVITQAEFDCSFEQTIARAGLRETPKPGSRQYEDLRNATMGDLLDVAWIQAEAEDRGITASDREIDGQLQQIVAGSFRCPPEVEPFECKEFKQFVESSQLSEDDVLLRVKLQVLSQGLQEQITGEAAAISAEQIEDYYEAAQEQFTLQASRDIRVVLNKDRAKVEEAKARLERDDSEQSWEEVAKELSTDVSSKNNGGLRQGLTEGLLEEPLNREVFAAAEGEIVGPVETPLGFYVLEVVKVTPETVQPLSEVQRGIRAQLVRTEQQDAFAQFVDDYGSSWQTRTVCDEDYLVERCSNFEGTGHPQSAPPGCYEESPKGGRPDSCPAPVFQAAPTLPGSVDAVTPTGLRLPQRPQPAGLKPPPATGLPGGAGGSPVPISP